MRRKNELKNERKRNGRERERSTGIEKKFKFLCSIISGYGRTRHVKLFRIIAVI